MWKWWVGAALCTVGCGSTSAGSSGGAGAAGAGSSEAGAAGAAGADGGNASPAACEEFLTELCARAAECWTENIDGGHSREQDVADCSNAVHQSVTCEDVVAVSDSYSSCLEHAQSTPCYAFEGIQMGTAPPIPSDCAGVLMLQAQP